MVSQCWTALVSHWPTTLRYIWVETRSTFVHLSPCWQCRSATDRCIFPWPSLWFKCSSIQSKYFIQRKKAITVISNCWNINGWSPSWLYSHLGYIHVITARKKYFVFRYIWSACLFQVYKYLVEMVFNHLGCWHMVTWATRNTSMGRKLPWQSQIPPCWHRVKSMFHLEISNSCIRWIHYQIPKGICGHQLSHGNVSNGAVEHAQWMTSGNYKQWLNVKNSIISVLIPNRAVHQYHGISDKHGSF